MDFQPVPNWGSIPRMLRDQAEHHPAVEVVHGVSLTGDTVTLTLAELREGAAAVARGLLALGVEKGDRVAIWAPNTPEWVITCYGLWDVGAIVSPISTRFKGMEALEQIRKAEPKVLFVSDGFMGTPYVDLLTEAAGTEPLPAIVRYGAEFEAFLAGGSAVPVQRAEERALAVHGDDLAEIMATSGSTGVPKGVMLHTSQLLRGYWDWSEVVTLQEGDRYPIIAPFSHGFGINAGLLACVLRRATMMPIPVFQPGGLMDLIEQQRVSILAGAPAMFFKILEELDGRDVSSLRVLICGAAAVPAELILRLNDGLGLDRMINAYGLMEGTVVSMTREGDPVEIVAGTTGRAVPGVSLRVVDDQGHDVPTGERGEILVGGYGVMRGYWRDAERTRDTVDAQGWLWTGDVGTLDEAGNLAIVDRKKEMFIVNGFNAYPAEIESFLLRHPEIAQAAVIGVPDAGYGEVGWAYLVLQPGSSLTEQQIVAWSRANMSNYKVPRRVHVVTALPLNANGKVDKPLLKAEAAATV